MCQINASEKSLLSTTARRTNFLTAMGIFNSIFEIVLHFICIVPNRSTFFGSNHHEVHHNHHKYDCIELFHVI